MYDIILVHLYENSIEKPGESCSRWVQRALEDYFLEWPPSEEAVGWTARALLATAGRHEHCNPMALRGPPRYDRVGAHESLRGWLPELLASLEAEQTRSSFKKSAKVVIITYAVFAALSGLAMAFAAPPCMQ